jgi:hypothetical protein
MARLYRYDPLGASRSLRPFRQSEGEHTQSAAGGNIDTPNHVPTYVAYATSLAQKGRFQEAEAAFRHSQLGMNPGVQAWLYVRQGNVDAARKVLKENASSPINPFTAVAHYLVGEQERGLTELDYLANEAWANKTYFLRTDPLFDAMRGDPRFTEIVKKTGLLDN